MGVYHYIYYRIYRLAESSSLPWWSDLKAGFLMAAIEMALLALIEYKIAFLLSIQGADVYGMWGYVLIIAVPPLIINYFLFLYGSKWKVIINHFDEIDKVGKYKMNLQMTVVFLLLVGLFIFLLLL